MIRRRVIPTLTRRRYNNNAYTLFLKLYSITSNSL
jgi:hypothetical protein